MLYNSLTPHRHACVYLYMVSEISFDGECSYSDDKKDRKQVLQRAVECLSDRLYLIL